MKLNLTHEDIDRLRGHARDGGAIKGEDLLNLLQDWVTLEEGRKKTKVVVAGMAEAISAYPVLAPALGGTLNALAEAVGWGDCVVRDDLEGMPWEGRK
jgi:hypothetical protein